MPPAKPALALEPSVARLQDPSLRRAVASAPAPGIVRSQPHPGPTTIRPVPSVTRTQSSKEKAQSFQARVPVVTGTATFRGSMVVDGMILGQMDGSGSSATLKQRSKTNVAEPKPDLVGELSFKDMLRINGYVAGTITSSRGTLIIDASARVDAQIEVAVCVIGGTVNGDVIATERVELGSGAVIRGNISTRSIAIKPGAIFQGDCRMLKDDHSQG